jgi:RNA polymerase sigma-70 factor (ECF subfamily)
MVCSIVQFENGTSNNVSSSKVATKRPETRATAPSPRREEEEELRGWMLEYQHGELAAFEALYDRLAPRIRSYLSYVTWNHATTEDLLQETFLQIHRSRHTYRPGRPVQPWAIAIARHVYLMFRRAAARRARHEDESLEPPDFPVPPAVEKLATRNAVMRALATLTADRREAVLLHHVWGFSYGEMGALLGIREGTAKLRAHRALNALREQLGTELSEREQ